MAAICALTAGGSAAQTPAAPAQTATERADSVQWHFGLVTVAPGREVYQLEGHTALRIRNSAVFPFQRLLRQANRVQVCQERKVRCCLLSLLRVAVLL